MIFSVSGMVESDAGREKVKTPPFSQAYKNVIYDVYLSLAIVVL
jgi:hypothetical protein